MPASGGYLWGSRTRPQVLTWAPMRPAPILLLRLGDLAGDDQLTIVELDVELVLVHPGELDLDLVAIVGLGYVGQRPPRRVQDLPGRQGAERHGDQLPHPVVDVFELTGRVDHGYIARALASRKLSHHGTSS